MRPQDAFSFALLFCTLVYVGCFAHGCAAPPSRFLPDPAAAAAPWQDTVPIHAAVFIKAGDKVCSGVSVSESEIVTAAHCVRDLPAVETVVYPGVAAPAAVARVDPARDLAWLTLDGKAQAVAKVGKMLPGELDVVFASGFGCFGVLDVHAGLFVSPENRELVLAMGVCQGDSGGPVFNRAGEVIGIVIRRNPEKPIAVAARYLEGA